MKLRASNISKLKGNTFDVLIVGGGINGAVSAAALAARGVQVALIDREDFAGCTSSNSSNLAWGGIKYLESHEYLLIENAEYLRCEIRQAAIFEMITRLEDFLRRRSKIAQVVRHRDIIAAPGLREILFGDQAQEKLREYVEGISTASTVE